MSRGELVDKLLDQMYQVNLPIPGRELRFMPKGTRRWRFDLHYLDLKLAIEVEGGTWINGAHTRGKHYAEDCEKYSMAAIMGWKVIRVTSDMIASGRALQLIIAALNPTKENLAPLMTKLKSVPRRTRVPRYARRT